MIARFTVDDLEGAEFSDGTVVVRRLGVHGITTQYESLDEFLAEADRDVTVSWVDHQPFDWSSHPDDPN